MRKQVFLRRGVQESFFLRTDSGNRSERLQWEERVSSAIFETIKALEAAHLHFFIERTRPDTIRLSVTLVGERIEIDIFEDNHLEISRFHGDESIEGGAELLTRILQEQE